MSTACPCASGHAYDRCCGPLHRGAPAPHAEALMRSRYSAYFRADADYLRATWHPRTRPAALDFHDAAATRWLGLEVRRHTPAGTDLATVEFVARYGSAVLPPCACTRSAVSCARTAAGGNGEFPADRARAAPS